MNHLTRNDYAGALRLLARLERQSGDLESFARASVKALNEFVASELGTLSVCDLVTGHRQVVGLPGVRLGADDIACFDRHFFSHPLVLHHGLERGASTRRISDLLGRRDFHRTALYADYYRRIGLEFVIAVPLFMDGRTLVSIVLNRRGLDFSERDRERLDLLRPHLAFLYRQACLATGASLNAGQAVALAPVQADPLPAELTLREGEVMHWLSCGKTDFEIAALLSISPRTVQKHLEHIYVKLGVETRTAAVMRALATRQAADGASAQAATRRGVAGVNGVNGVLSVRVGLMPG
jgi:DNA-binding CsgD family transcriptional regulator